MKKQAILVVILSVVMLIAFLLIRGKADGIRYDDLGVSLSDVTERVSECYFMDRKEAIFSILPRKEKGQLWLGTSDGIVICSLDGSVVKRILGGKKAGAHEEKVLHHGVTELVRLSDGKIAARGIFGAVLLDENGKVLENCETDASAIESLRDAILKEPAMQKWFPTLGNQVYLPYAANLAGCYDGKQWSTVNTIHQSNANLSKKIRKVGNVVAAPSHRTFYDISTGAVVYEGFGAVENIAPGVDLLAGYGRTDLISNGKTISLCDNFICDDVLKTRHLGKSEFFFWSINSDALGIVYGYDGESPKCKRISLPDNVANNRLVNTIHQVVPLEDRAVFEQGRKINGRDDWKVFVLAGNSVYVSDLEVIEKMTEIPRTASNNRLGTHVFSAATVNDTVVLGTSEGLWIWKPGDDKPVRKW